MGCGASKEPTGAHYAGAVRSGPSWIERKDGITIEDAVTRIRAELKIKANLSDEEILAIARQQRGLEKEAEEPHSLVVAELRRMRYPSEAEWEQLMPIRSRSLHTSSDWQVNASNCVEQILSSG